MNIDNIRKIINKLPDAEAERTVYLSREKTQERIRKIISKMRAKIIEKCEAEHWTISPDEVEHVLDEMILNALEKQVVVRKPIGEIDNGRLRYKCRNCGNEIDILDIAKSAKHCCECGQALDWGEVE